MSNYLKPVRMHIVRLIFRQLPETRFFKLKSLLLKWGGVEIGECVQVCSSVVIFGSGQLRIGDHTWLGHEVLITASGLIDIGSHVDIGPRVYLGTGTHELDRIGPRAAGRGINKTVVIGEGSWLGAESLVLPGVTLGRKVVVAAGAVVVKDVKDNSVVAGVPASAIKTKEVNE